MTESYLLNTLNLYEKSFIKVFENNFSGQLEIVKNFQFFLASQQNCFSRCNQYGHITGSAFILNKNLSHVLLTYHAKLKKWLQLGGHADDNFIIQDVALKEAREESGIENFDFVDVFDFPQTIPNTEQSKILPFDLDIHVIPERKIEPEHHHFDVRFILLAHEEDFKISEESLDLKWIPIDEVSFYTQENSTLRQVEKIKYLKLKKSF